MDEESGEPNMNVLCWKECDKDLILCVIPRSKHRPDCYFKNNNEHYCISPGSVDMGGLIITPMEEDFKRLTAEKAEQILQEVAFTQEQIQECIQKMR